MINIHNQKGLNVWLKHYLELSHRWQKYNEFVNPLMGKLVAKYRKQLQCNNRKCNSLSWGFFRGKIYCKRHYHLKRIAKHLRVNRGLKKAQN